MTRREAKAIALRSAAILIDEMQCTEWAMEKGYCDSDVARLRDAMAEVGEELHRRADRFGPEQEKA